MQRRHLGDKAELLARLWLEGKGYEFIGGNFARRVGEIDLIMRAT